MEGCEQQLLLKKEPTPQLELTGYLSISRLYNICKEALESAQLSGAKTVFWLDSQTILAWIKTPPQNIQAVCLGESCSDSGNS